MAKWWQKLFDLRDGDEDKYVIARSPHDHQKHTFHHNGTMKGFDGDEDIWTSDNGYTFTTDALVEEQLKDE